MSTLKEFVLLFVQLVAILDCGSSVGASEPWTIAYPSSDASNSSQKLCLLARFTTELFSADNEQEVLFELNTDNKTSITHNAKCNESYAVLQIRWTAERNWTQMTLIFNQDFHNKEDMIVERISLGNETHESIVFSDLEQLSAFRVKEKYSFKCSAATGLTSEDGNFKLLLSDVQWEVGRDKDNKKSDENSFLKIPQKCESDVQLSKSAPIIAGIVMGCLTVVVVVFLVFGRFRYRKIDDKY